jgi:hypothetical protein
MRRKRMQFENNWVYPWPDTAYDPVLKVRMSIGGGGRESENDDVSIRIEYDPQIEAGRYSKPKTQEQRERFPEVADKPIPFVSPQSENIIMMWRDQRIGASDTFAAHNEIHGTVRRIKMYRLYTPGNTHGIDPVWTLEHKVKYIKANNYPILSRYPRDFLLYAFKNYIGITKLNLNRTVWPVVPNTDVKRIEMCLHADVITKFFNLPLSEYQEVETDWYCISALELNHESV